MCVSLAELVVYIYFPPIFFLEIDARNRILKYIFILLFLFAAYQSSQLGRCSGTGSLIKEFSRRAFRRTVPQPPFFKIVPSAIALFPTCHNSRRVPPLLSFPPPLEFRSSPLSLADLDFVRVPGVYVLLFFRLPPSKFSLSKYSLVHLLSSLSWLVPPLYPPSRGHFS